MEQTQRVADPRALACTAPARLRKPRASAAGNQDWLRRHEAPARQRAEKRLAERRGAYDRDAATLTTAQAESLKREIDALDRAIKRNRDNLRTELKTRSDQVLDGSWRDINNVVVEFARDQSYDLIVQSPVIYANPRVDVTEAVLERLRKELRKSSANP